MCATMKDAVLCCAASLAQLKIGVMTAGTRDCNGKKQSATQRAEANLFMIFFWIISENETASTQNSCVEYWTKYNEGSIIQEYTESVYEDNDAPTNSLECQKLCQNHSGCLHWSYRLPGINRGYRSMGQCTLFSSLSSISTPNINPQYQTSGYISGSKNCTHVSCVEKSRRYMS